MKKLLNGNDLGFDRCFSADLGNILVVLWQISLAVWVFVVVAVGLNLFTMKWHTKIAFCCLMMVADGY